MSRAISWRPQVLFDRHREIGAALDRRVVGDDDAFAARDAADAGDDAGRRHRAVIHLIGGEAPKIRETATRIEQQPDALARQQLAAPLVPPRATPRRRPARSLPLLSRRSATSARIAAALARNAVGAAVEQGGKNRHRRRILPAPPRSRKAWRDRRILHV